MSPAATTPGAASRVSSQTTPSSRVRPEPSSHSVLTDTPMPTTTTSAATDVPSVRVTPVTRRRPWSEGTRLEVVDPRAEADVDPVLDVEPTAHRAHLGAEHPLERHRQGLDEGDVETEGATRRGHLGADEPGADHDDPRRRRPRGRTAGPWRRRACAPRGRRRCRRCRAVGGPRHRWPAPACRTRPRRDRRVARPRPTRASRSRPVARTPSCRSRSRSSVAAGNVSFDASQPCDSTCLDSGGLS